MTRVLMTSMLLGSAAAFLVLSASPLAQSTFAAQGTSGPRESIQDVLQELNSSSLVQGSDRIKSYEILFDAYLDLTEPPFTVGIAFNLTTIHPGMDGWDDVSAWAESNPHMADAIIRVKDRRIVGLPYGRENVPQKFRSANLVADVAADGDLRRNEFPYLNALETISAFTWAEVYRLMEGNQVDRALELAMAHLAVVRQFCDRDFMREKVHSISLLTDALSNTRDVFYLYMDRISADQFRDIAVSEIPFLRPDRNALFMPEGDRIVSEALIRGVFDSRGQADREKFPSTFAAIQADDEPLTRFGAARRWAMIAEVHGSLDASLERLTLVYDDWWRRWRVQEYDPILDVQTQFDRTNAIRYAAVLESIQNIEDLFEYRKQLIVAVNGTAVSAGICAYKRTFGTIPRDHKLTYAQFVRKASDVDPYDRAYDHLSYIHTNSRHSIDTSYGRIWVERDQGILYSRGQNHHDDRAVVHTDDGMQGDIVVWPPIRALARQQNLLD